MSSAVTQKGIANHEAIAAAKAGNLTCMRFSPALPLSLPLPPCHLSSKRTSTATPPSH
jgi:hypothetical protein